MRMRDLPFRRTALAVLSVTACVHAGPAQSAATTEGAGKSTWYMYFGDHSFSKHWALHLEGQYRRQGIGQRWEELVARPGVDREFGHGFTAMLAYTYVRRYPFAPGSLGAADLTGPQPEHRISEDLNYTHRLLRGQHPPMLTHRVRVEQRFLGSAEEGVGTLYWRSGDRARYRLTADFPLGDDIRGFRPGYLSVYNEVFTKFGAHSGTAALDQNRTYGAVGFNLSKTEQFEVGYLHQYMPVSNGTYGESNNALQFTLLSNAPLRFGLHKRRKKADTIPARP